MSDIEDPYADDAFLAYRRGPEGEMNQPPTAICQRNGKKAFRYLHEIAENGRCMHCGALSEDTGRGPDDFLIISDEKGVVEIRPKRQR